MATAVIFAIILAMLLLLLGMAGYTLVSAVIGALLEFFRELPSRSRRESSRGGRTLPEHVDPEVGAPEIRGSEISVDDMWHRMQGTSQKPHRWRRTGRST